MNSTVAVALIEHHKSNVGKMPSNDRRGKQFIQFRENFMVQTRLTGEGSMRSADIPHSATRPMYARSDLTIGFTLATDRNS